MNNTEEILRELETIQKFNYTCCPNSVFEDIRYCVKNFNRKYSSWIEISYRGDTAVYHRCPVCGYEHNIGDPQESETGHTEVIPDKIFRCCPMCTTILCVGDDRQT